MTDKTLDEMAEELAKSCIVPAQLFMQEVEHLLHARELAVPKIKQALQAVADKEREEHEDRIDHLMRCKEFQSDLQNRVLELGAPLLDVPAGKTFFFDQAFAAIEAAIRKQTNND